MTFLGVYLITSGRARGAGDQDHDGLDSEESTIGMIDEERYQDEVDNDEEEDNRKRRKSSASVAFEDSTNRRESKVSLGRNMSQSPRTPPPFLSYTSTTSSRHSNAESPLLKNPWGPSQERPRPLENTTSSPLLPSEAQRFGAPLTPQASRGERRLSLKAGRPSALSRQSMARLAPGPLMSPLSSSLSAVVADKRRGLDSPSTQRRPGPGLRQSKSQRASKSSTGGDAMTESSPSKRAQPPEEVVDEEDLPATTTPQSASATLGEFLRLKRERSEGKAVDRNEDDTHG